LPAFAFVPEAEFLALERFDPVRIRDFRRQFGQLGQQSVNIFPDHLGSGMFFRRLDETETDQLPRDRLGRQERPLPETNEQITETGKRPLLLNQLAARLCGRRLGHERLCTHLTIASLQIFAVEPAKFRFAHLAVPARAGNPRLRAFYAVNGMSRHTLIANANVLSSLLTGFLGSSGTAVRETIVKEPKKVGERFKNLRLDEQGRGLAHT
jgi:hypothetical protein